jgi:two-component system nitrate/nitrite response regulator NarL
VTEREALAFHERSATETLPIRRSRTPAVAGRLPRSPCGSRKPRSLVPAVLAVKSPLFRAGLIHILAGSQYRVKAGASDLFELAESVFNDRPCVALVSLDGEVAATLAKVRSLTERYKGLHVISLTERLCPEELLAAIDAGADGYLLRNEISAAALLRSLDLVLLGGVVIPQGFSLKDRVQPQPDAFPALQDSEVVSGRGKLPPPIDAAQTDDAVRMSERERTILAHLMEGASNKHIARALNIAEATVKVHVKSLLIKIRAKNRTQAATWAMGRVWPTRQLKQQPASFPTGGDGKKGSATIPIGDSANSRNELPDGAESGPLCTDIDFKGGFG